MLVGVLLANCCFVSFRVGKKTLQVKDGTTGNLAAMEKKALTWSDVTRRLTSETRWPSDVEK